MSEEEDYEYDNEEEELEVKEQPKQKKKRIPIIDECVDEVLGDDLIEFWTN